MFIVALFTIAKGWEHSKCPLADERVRKMWPIRTMRYHSALKGKEGLTRAAAW